MPAAAPPDTRSRLLEGAARVFAERGLLGATTREIATAAGVNEVTLFRHFQSKQRLLAAVIEHVFARTAPVDLPAGSDLRAILRAFAHSHARRLERNIALVRVLVGEIQHCDEQERRIVREVFRTEKQELIAHLRCAQEAGKLRAGADPVLAADHLGAIVFTGVIRRCLPFTPEYGFAQYLDEAVETLSRGLEKRRAR